MYDETQTKIIDATMNLIMDKGYSSTTTKNISMMAGVNECTIFRRFKSKKEIVIAAMELPQWNPCIREEDFITCESIRDSLISYSRTYMSKVTPQMVKVSIGLRTPELVDSTISGIMKVPEVFMKVLNSYFTKLIEEKRIKNCDAETLSLQFLSMNFGFVFLKASFQDKLSDLSQDEYIKSSVEVFVSGIEV